MSNHSEKQLEAMEKNSPEVHNGIYTIENLATGDYRTFKISTAKHGGLAGKRIIGLLTDSNNENDFRNFGFVFRNFGFVNANGIYTWRKQSGSGSVFPKYASMVWRLLVLNNLEGYSIEASTTCCRCNRNLTTPESIRLGIGAVCADKM